VRVWARVLTGDAREWWVVVGVVSHERMRPAHDTIVAHAHVKQVRWRAQRRGRHSQEEVCDRASHTDECAARRAARGPR
jgi:hypothetical protein